MRSMVTVVVVMICAAFTELWVIAQVASWIGVLPTLLVMIASTVFGGWVIRREGVGAWRRASQSVRAGEAPTLALVDGALVLVSGMLLILPGLITSVIGLLLAVPVLRSAVRPLATRSVERRVSRRMATVHVTSVGSSGFGFGTSFGGPGWPGASGPETPRPNRYTDFIDLDAEEVFVDETPHSIEPPSDRPR